MNCPTLPEINAAMRAVMVTTLSAYSADITIIPEAQESGPNAAKILVLQAFRPEGVTGAELGGRIGLSRRSGNFLITLSIPKGEKVKTAQALKISDILSDDFRMLELVCVGGGMAYTYEPYVTNAGRTEDNRYSIMVTVPWTAWIGGK